MWFVSFFCLLVLSPILALTEPLPSFKGNMRIPIDMKTAKGSFLKKGRYQLEVKSKLPSRVLYFFLGGEIQAVVEATSNKDPEIVTAEVPLVGTHQRRSTAIKLAPAKDRQRSKTGLARYQEERHRWEGVIRVYESLKTGAIFFVFQEREEKEEWSRFYFKLYRSSASDNNQSKAKSL